MKVVTDNKHYNDIAAAIREKTATENTYTPAEMASGVNDVYDAGKQAEYDRFWDKYQTNGRPLPWGGYTFAGNWWNDETFNPKYDIITGAGNAAYYFLNNGVTNLRDKIDRRGLKLDLITGKTTAIQGLFEGCNSAEAPDFDSGTITNLSSLFYNCTKMHTIPRLNMTKCTKADLIFQNAKALQNITFEGEIPLSVSFSSSPLTVESMKSVITHLKNYAGTDKEFTYKVTFSSACLTALEAEGATSPNGNNWLDYMTDLGWNY